MSALNNLAEAVRAGIDETILRLFLNDLERGTVMLADVRANSEHLDQALVYLQSAQESLTAEIESRGGSLGEEVDRG